VIPDNFEYIAPASLREVIGLLQEHPDDAKVLAGGQSLIPLMKFRLASPAYLIDLRRVPGLAVLEEHDGTLVIGSMVREAALESSELIQRRYSGLADTSAVVADPLVRNFATVGGNLAHADPANDHPAMMLALRAEVVAEGPSSRRQIPVETLLVDALETSLAPDEVLIEIRVPRPLPHTGSAYVKLERKVGDYAIVGAAACITLDGNICTQAGLGLTNVGSKAIRPLAAESFLVGKRLDEGTILEAARRAIAAAEPTADLRGPAEYKRAMVRTLTARALRRAAQRALEGGAQ
jgi:aerobic carbon-monoxide dehydrogenase medium subunit